MAHTLRTGQKLTITNLDHNIWHEEWTVVAVELPIITFSCTKWNAVDIAYVEYSSTQTVVGSVVKNDAELIIAFSQYAGMEVGLCVVGDQATYLRSVDPLENA